MDEPNAVELAVDYAKNAQEFLRIKLGHEADPSDLEDFQTHLIASIQADLLHGKRERGTSPKGIELLFGLVFSLTQTYLRSHHNSSLVLKAKAQVSEIRQSDFIPASPFKPEETVKEHTHVEKTCRCAKLNGLCERCSTIIAGLIDVFMECIFKIIAQSKPISDICRPCLSDQSDACIADGLRRYKNRLTRKAKTFVPVLLSVLPQYTQKMEWPLTEAAIREIAESEDQN